eukprot:2865916-Prymnesium_polylepis.2
MRLSGCRCVRACALADKQTSHLSDIVGGITCDGELRCACGHVERTVVFEAGTRVAGVNAG